MMRSLFSLLPVVLLLSLSLMAAGCLQDEAAPPEGQYISNETLIAFVEDAVAYVRENGKEKALEEFNDPEGLFVKGELYIYAYDFNGTALAHPVSPEKIGVNRLNETEGGVGAFLVAMNEAIRNGENFHRIEYINPLHNRALESKLAYAVQVDDDWWLGSGVYAGPAGQSS